MTDPRPFRVLGVQQVALAGTSKRTLRTLWVELLGLRSLGSHRLEAENVDEERLQAGAGELAVEIDLMEALDPDAHPRIAERPLNHVGLWVDDLRAAHGWLSARGVRFAPGGIRAGAAGHEICFIHPKGAPEAPQGGEGALIELVQAPPEVIAAFEAASR